MKPGKRGNQHLFRGGITYLPEGEDPGGVAKILRCDGAPHVIKTCSNLSPVDSESVVREALRAVLRVASLSRGWKKYPSAALAIYLNRIP